MQWNSTDVSGNISLPSSGLKSKTKVKLPWSRQQVKFVPCQFLVLNHSWTLKRDTKYSSETSAEVISYKASINIRRCEPQKSYNKDFDYKKVFRMVTLCKSRVRRVYRVVSKFEFRDTVNSKTERHSIQTLQYQRYYAAFPTDWNIQTKHLRHNCFNAVLFVTHCQRAFDRWKQFD
jgi:hypothetical protein